MRLSAQILAAALAALALLVAPVGAGAAPAPERAKPDYKAYASCADKKPYKAAHRCGYDAGKYFRATFVFRSNVGKRAVKACFKVFGAPPLGGGHGCAKLDPLAYRAYPFKIAGIRQPFSVKLVWFAKEPGSDSGFERVASSFLRVHT
jgi:hypothetical protein